MQYDWKKIINSQKESTLTVKEFCRQNNICVSSFYKSKRRLENDDFKVFNLFLSRLWMMPTPMYQWTIDGHCIDLILHFLTESLVLSNDHQRWWSQEYLRFNSFRDMRKSIDGLTLIVHSQFQMNVLDHSLFIFTNRSRNRIKILYYESNGFWLFIKRLEHGKFKIQESQESLTRAITSRQLSWLLEGLEYDEKLKEKQLLI